MMKQPLTNMDCTSFSLMLAFFFFLDENLDEEMRDIVEKSARHLYGLIHARFIITTHGLTKMVGY